MCVVIGQMTSFFASNIQIFGSTFIFAVNFKQLHISFKYYCQMTLEKCVVQRLAGGH